LNKPPLLIVSPLYGDVVGGLGGHTRRLARMLGDHFQTRVLSNTDAPVLESESDLVLPLMSRWNDASALMDTITKHAPSGPILWQYVPHMYGRGGVNHALPQVMAQLKKTGRRQVVLAHEIAAGLSLWPHRLYYTFEQRWLWSRVRQLADAIGISTEAWFLHWQHQCPSLAHKLILTPSPSNFDDPQPIAAARLQFRQSLGLSDHCRVLGYFGTVSQAKQLSWVQSAWEQAQTPAAPVALVIVGDTPPLPANHPLKSLFHPLGYCHNEQVRQSMQGIDLLAFPFSDGASERRGSLMCGLAQGRAVITTAGHNTGPTLRKADFMVAVPVDQPQAFAEETRKLIHDEERCQLLGRKGQQAYQEYYSWTKLQQRLLPLLSPPS
jgi:glycosyltransferase involved in cell wall biosynthesis